MLDKKRSPPLKINQAMVEALSAAIAKGNYPTTACQLCNIDRTSLYRWLDIADAHIAEGKESIYTTLYYSLKRAESDAEDRLVQVVRDAAEVKREWLPAMTMLERRHPDRWGRKDRTTIDINEKKSVQITHEVINLNSTERVIEGECKELEGGE